MVLPKRIWFLANLSILIHAGYGRMGSTCPDDLQPAYVLSGEERCVCPSGTVCEGPECVHGHMHKDKSATRHGFKARCGNKCKCTPTNSVGGSNEIQKPPKTEPDFMKKSAIKPENEIYARRKCAQKALFGALGFDYNEDYFVMGCNSPVMWDFENWAKSTGCGWEPYEGTLMYHTAWTGPIDKYVTEFEALMDSWLMTQDTSRSEFHFWWMDRDPDPTDPFVKKYSELSEGHIQFHRADLYDLAKGTCLENNHSYLNASVPPDWKEAGVMGPKEKADLTRILLLNRHGGIWMDTDDVLLRDLRPLIEFAGEFATKLTMSFYFNNNILGTRPESDLTHSLVEIVCRLPYSRDTRAYCKEVREYCYPKWYWNHGVFQIARREGQPFVAYPMSMTDPAYGCYPPMLLSSSGGAPIRNWDLDQVLDMIRGTFVLHTRGYNAKKPLPPDSNFGKLYALAKREALKKDPRPRPIVKLGPRNSTEQKAYDLVYNRLKETQVEPPFYPKSEWKLVQFQSADKPMCLYAQRSPGTYGPLSDLELREGCASEKVLNQEEKELSKMLERHTWIYHESSGHIRPAIREPGRIYCLDGTRNQGRPLSKTGDVPIVGVCHPARESQTWSLLRVNQRGDGKEYIQIKNQKTGLCIVSTEAPKDTRLQKGQAAPPDRVPLLSPCLEQPDSTQLFVMAYFKHASHGKLRTLQ